MQGYLPHYISRLMNTLNLRLLESLRPHGITIQQFRVMQALDARGVSSVGEISADTVIEQSVVSRIVDQLERAKYAVRRKRPTNSRVVEVCLTPLGESTYASLFPYAKAIVDDATSALNPQERKILESLLQRLFEHVRRPYAPWLVAIKRNNGGA
ncbi:MAG: MarR family winged helix-turn-helix transcriptional regulator [Alphaproteobacteria bacterium]